MANTDFILSDKHAEDFVGFMLWLAYVIASVVNSYLWCVPYIGLGFGTQVPLVMPRRSGTS